MCMCVTATEWKSLWSSWLAEEQKSLRLSAPVVLARPSGTTENPLPCSQLWTQRRWRIKCRLPPALHEQWKSSGWSCWGLYLCNGFWGLLLLLGTFMGKQSLPPWIELLSCEGLRMTNDWNVEFCGALCASLIKLGPFLLSSFTSKTRDSTERNIFSKRQRTVWLTQA